MDQRKFDIDILRALSVVEGAVKGSGDTQLEEVVMEQLGWIINSITRALKDEK